MDIRIRPLGQDSAVLLVDRNSICTFNKGDLLSLKQEIGPALLAMESLVGAIPPSHPFGEPWRPGSKDWPCPCCKRTDRNQVYNSGVGWICETCRWSNIVE